MSELAVVALLVIGPHILVVEIDGRVKATAKSQSHFKQINDTGRVDTS